MMVLYSGTTCPFSHRCRFVLFEKGMDFEIRDVDLYNKPEDISVMNPYGQVPILVERDLILYESNIINEYIDERFPASTADAGRSGGPCPRSPVSVEL
jgi:RNA polymerase-associated protein